MERKVQHGGQTLRRVTSADRKTITLAVSRNRRWRKWEMARQEARVGPCACVHCGSEPCGASWPEGRCCHRCSHESMPKWRASHVLWFRKKPFYVMEIGVGKTGLYYRQDGVVHFVRRSSEWFFLGARMNPPEFSVFAVDDPEGFPEGETADENATRYRIVGDEPGDEHGDDETEDDESGEEEEDDTGSESTEEGVHSDGDADGDDDVEREGDRDGDDE